MAMLLDTGKACASIFFLLITAQMYSRMLTLSRLPETLTNWASALDVPGLVILLAFVVVLIILGCIIDSVSILLLTMPIMVPIAATLGYDKVWFGMIAIVTIELGLLTPPFGMVVFAMKASLPPDVRIEEIFLGSAPFFVVLLLALALVIAFPQISLFIPRLLLGLDFWSSHRDRDFHASSTSIHPSSIPRRSRPRRSRSTPKSSAASTPSRKA